MNAKKLLEIAEALDRLMTTDISGRGVINVLYTAARNKVNQPLTAGAIDLLRNNIQPGDTVIITTGWVDQPQVAPGCGESDGPPGAVVLARALRLALKAIPIIVVDECLVAGLKQVARSAGFHCVAPENLHYSIEKNKLLTLAILPFPVDNEQAKQAASTIIDNFQPKVCIAIERGGMNEVGMIHNMAGWETGQSQAKLDYLFLTARHKNIATLAIGDGGNELGMANICDDIRQHIPYATKCQCPCGKGLTPSTTVDLLVTSTISNWGAYALAALLGASMGVLDALHTPEREMRILNATADADFHDPLYGSVTPSVDGCIADVQMAMVRLMQEIVLRRESC